MTLKEWEHAPFLELAEHFIQEESTSSPGGYEYRVDDELLEKLFSRRTDLNGNNRQLRSTIAAACTSAVVRQRKESGTDSSVTIRWEDFRKVLDLPPRNVACPGPSASLAEFEQWFVEESLERTHALLRKAAGDDRHRVVVDPNIAARLGKYLTPKAKQKFFKDGQWGEPLGGWERVWTRADDARVNALLQHLDAHGLIQEKKTGQRLRQGVRK